MDGRLLVPERLRPAMRLMKHRLLPPSSLLGWSYRNFATPSATKAKRSVLHRYGDPSDTWIETGTFMGDTTDFLSRSAAHVYSIEPQPQLYARAKQRFLERDNVTVIEGLSEDCIGALLDSITGPVSLWLDGHYSAGSTHKGPIDTPIRQELHEVAERIHSLDVLTVLVDDVRCFNPKDPQYASYPDRSWLVQWADSCALNWTIEHDIFVATKGRGSL